MTITLQAVNELIASLESAGELSIREQKFLKLAKAFKQLAEENAALKQYALDCVNAVEFWNSWADKEDQIHNDMETPATDAYLAGIKADAIDEAAVELDRVDTVASTRVIGFKLREFAQQLREGAK